jgi:hypothetical protein
MAMLRWFRTFSGSVSLALTRNSVCGKGKGRDEMRMKRPMSEEGCVRASEKGGGWGGKRGRVGQARY